MLEFIFDVQPVLGLILLVALFLIGLYNNIWRGW